MKEAGPVDSEIWRILSMGRHHLGDSSTIGITRGALERLAQVVEFKRIGRGHATFNFDHDRRGRLRVFPIRHQDIVKFSRWGAFNHKDPPMQLLPRRAR